MKNDRHVNGRLFPARVIGLFGLAVLLFVSCTISDDVAQERAKIAEKSTGDVIVGAVASWRGLQNGLWQGIEMAVDEINGRGGVLSGRKLRIIKKDSHGSVADACNIANEFAQNMNMIAVISGDHFSIAPSVIYQYYGMLLLNVRNVGAELSDQGFSLAFQTAPNAYTISEFITKFCLHRKLKTLLVLYEQSNYYKSIIDACAKVSQQTGVKFSKYSLTYTHGEHGTVLSQKFIASIPAIAKSVDAFYILGQQLGTFRLIARIAKANGMDKPMLTNNLFDYQIAPDPPDLTKPIFYATIFDAASKRPVVRKFVQAYQGKYHSAPDTFAAQGYDAVYAITHAIQMGKSSAPPDMAAALSKGVGADGVTGQLKFNEYGSREDLADLRIKEYNQGTYRYVYPDSSSTK